MDELGEALMKGLAYVGAGICMGLGGIGPGIGEGLIGGRAVEGIARRPEEHGQIFKTMLIGMAFVESCAIYALVISLLLLFK